MTQRCIQTIARRTTRPGWHLPGASRSRSSTGCSSRDGQTRWVLDRMRPEGTAEDGCLLVDGVVADITARKRIEAEAIEKLAHAALRDSLTGLANRTAFLEHLDSALVRAGRTDKGAAVLFIDLDNFKLVNDSFGHSAGDELLKAVGSRLRAAIRQTDVVARQGGDEFLILLSDLERNPTEETAFMGAAEVVANTLRRSLRAPFLVEGIEIYISASVGISLYPSDADDSTTLLKHADVAMYTVKDAGRDGHALYRSRHRYGAGADLDGQPPAQDGGGWARPRAPLSAARGSRGQNPGRGGGTRPLAGRSARAGATGRFHPARRADRADWPAQRLGDRRGVQASTCLAGTGTRSVRLDQPAAVLLPDDRDGPPGRGGCRRRRRARAADDRGDRVGADPRHGTADGRHPRRHAQARA